MEKIVCENGPLKGTERNARVTVGLAFCLEAPGNDAAIVYVATNGFDEDGARLCRFLPAAICQLSD